jgi:hypothetical protein
MGLSYSEKFFCEMQMYFWNEYCYNAIQYTSFFEQDNQLKEGKLTPPAPLKNRRVFICYERFFSLRLYNNLCR